MQGLQAAAVFSGTKNMWAFIFPGQGSQSPGMGQFLFDNFSLARESFEEASDAINLDLKKLCFTGSEQELMLTENTQACITVVSTATERVLRKEFNFKISAVAGHSVGEYSALVAAGVLSLADAIKAVRLRGQAMQKAVPVGHGGMAAIMGANETEVQELCELACKNTDSPLSPANYNCPGQIVVSGSQKAVDWLKNGFKPEMLSAQPKRLKVIPLTVSAPFHCKLMQPAEDVMAEFLKSIPFKEAQIPVVQNINALPVSKPHELKENLIKQVTGSVLWQQSINQIKKLNINSLVESGSGKVLNTLVKKIDSDFFQTFNVNSLEDIKQIELFLKENRA